MPRKHAPTPLSPAPAALGVPATVSSKRGGLLLIVTGSTILAETRDRPLAYRLRERLLRCLGEVHESTHLDYEAAPASDSPEARLQPVVCSDLWYLNDRELADRPAIAVGEPNTNAATSLISSRLPTAFVIEGRLRVHMDPEFIDLRAAAWGVNAASTASAIDLFVERYLREFLAAAM